MIDDEDIDSRAVTGSPEASGDPDGPRPVHDEMGSLLANLAQRAKAAEEHAVACQVVPCLQCRRRSCPQCSSTFVQSDAEELCPACERRASMLRWAKPALASLPSKLESVDLDTAWLGAIVGSKAIALAKSSLSAPRVTFTGLPGSGKTSLAIAMFRSVLRKDAASPRKPGAKAEHLYISSFALAKARGNASLGREAPDVERALEAPLVVIDELGHEDPRYASAVTEVIYERHAQDRPTWITTGVWQKEIASRYGGGIARRVFEDAVRFELVRQP